MQERRIGPVAWLPLVAIGTAAGGPGWDRCCTIRRDDETRDSPAPRLAPASGSGGTGAGGGPAERRDDDGVRHDWQFEPNLLPLLREG